MTESTAAPMASASYPLHFVYRDLVTGQGFFAGIEAKGRVVLVQDEAEEGYWMHGVNPGSIAAHGTTPDEVAANLRMEYRAVLAQIAESSSSFVAFQAEVQGFFLASNLYYKKEWDQALEIVRRDGVSIEGLPKRPAPEPAITVLELPMVTAPGRSKPPAFQKAGENKAETELLRAA